MELHTNGPGLSGRLRCLCSLAHGASDGPCGASVRETPNHRLFSNSQLHRHPVVTGSPELLQSTEISFPATASRGPLISPALLINLQSTFTTSSPISAVSSPVQFSSQKCSSNVVLEQAVTLNRLLHLTHALN